MFRCYSDPYYNRGLNIWIRRSIYCPIGVSNNW
jgi:hypothetical protein